MQGVTHAPYDYFEENNYWYPCSHGLQNKILTKLLLDPSRILIGL